MKHSIGGQFIKTGKEIFDKLDSKVNFSDFKTVINYYGKNNSNELSFNQDKFRLQIGKMDENNTTIYGKELYGPALEYILSKAKETDQITIQLWPDLTLYRDNNKDAKILDFESQKQIIQKIISKYFPKKLQR